MRVLPPFWMCALDQFTDPARAAVSAALSCFEQRPLWGICIEMLGIVRRQSIQAQPLCLAAYRPARAVQPFDNLRHRVCWPQGDKLAEFLVGPAGHLGPRSWQPPAPCSVPTDSRRDFGDCIFSTAAHTRMRAACRATVVVSAVRCVVVGRGRGDGRRLAMVTRCAGLRNRAARRSSEPGANVSSSEPSKDGGPLQSVGRVLWEGDRARGLRDRGT